MKFLKMFNRDTPVFEDRPSIDVKIIDDSFQLLKTTTAEVSQAAVNAAKALQERLDDSENRFYWTIDSIEDFVLIKDGEGRWQTLNKFGQHLLSMHHGEFVGKTDHELAEDFPRLRDTLLYCVKTDIKAWETQTSSRSEERVPYGIGYRYLDMIKTPTYNDDGSRKELIIVGRDVTEVYEKSRREKACFQALNSASDAIAIIDQQARIFFCNDQFVEMFKFGKYQNVVDQELIDILPKFPNYQDMWQRVQQNKTWSNQCPDKKTQVTVIPMMNGQPHPIYYICTFKTGCPVE